MDSPPGAVNRDGGGLVSRAEACILERLPNERRRRPEDHFEESVSSRVEPRPHVSVPLDNRPLIACTSGTTSARPTNVSRSPPLEHRFRRHRCDDLVLPFDLDKEYTLEMAEATLLDAVPGKRSTLNHDHPDDELTVSLV